MPKCTARKGLMSCDLQAGHDGKHADLWILSMTETNPGPVEFELEAADA